MLENYALMAVTIYLMVFLLLLILRYAVLILFLHGPPGIAV